MCKRIGIVGLAIFLVGWVAPARANLSVTIGSTSIPQGGTGTINVYLTGDASTLDPDLINNYGIELQISGPNDLQFSSPPGTGYASEQQYLFAGDSFGVSATVSSVNGPNDTFTASDSTTSGNPISLSMANTPVLLATIALSAPTNSVNVGDAYLISLIPLGGNGSMTGGTPTFFDDFDFNGGGGEISAVPFTSTVGTVAITSSAVPEPAATITSLTGATLLTAYGVRRRRRSKAQRPEFL
jgi:hypothetical protein